MKLIFLDCETTGLDPATNAMIQVAGIVEIDGEVVEEFYINCRPLKGDFINADALAVNGVTMEDLRGYPSGSESLVSLKRIFDKYIDKYNKKDKFYLVAQNAQFDYDFLKFFFVKHNDHYFGSYIHYHKIDLIAITTVMKLAGVLDVPNMKLATIMEKLGLGKQTHDALDDVRALRKVFQIYLSWVKRAVPPLG